MDELKCYLKKIHNQLDAGFSKALRKYDLTCTQFDVLMYLANHTESQTTLTDISAHFGVKHTSAIHVLKILEKKGFISRNTAPHTHGDTRTKPIGLTRQGTQLILEIHEKNPLLNKVMFAGIAEKDLILLKKMLQQIYTNLDSDAFRNL